MSAPARTEEDAGDTADQELEDEAERPQHRRREPDRAAVERGDVEEHHLGDGDGDEHGGDREHVRHARVDAGDELVVRPHEEREHARADGRVQHESGSRTASCARRP
jgi:hypothetical protein